MVELVRHQARPASEKQQREPVTASTVELHHRPELLVARGVPRVQAVDEGGPPLDATLLVVGGGREDEGQRTGGEEEDLGGGAEDEGGGLGPVGVEGEVMRGPQGEAGRLAVCEGLA